MGIRVRAREADEFVAWCEETIFRRSRRTAIRPYDHKRDALVFSFDINLNLFIGNTYGWNHPPQKTYFTKTPAVMERVRTVTLKNGRINGGRVFLDNRRLFYVDLDSSEQTLCEVRWPSGRDVVSDVRGIWMKLPTRTYRFR